MAISGAETFSEAWLKAGPLVVGAGLLAFTAVATAFGAAGLAAALGFLSLVAALCMINLSWGIVLIPVVYFFRFSLFGMMTPEKAFAAFVFFLWTLSVLLRKRQGWSAPAFPPVIKGAFVFFLLVHLGTGLASGYSTSLTLVKTSQFFFKGLMVYLIYAIISDWLNLKRCLQALALVVFLFGVGVPWLIVEFNDLQAIRSLEVLYTNSWLFKFTQLKNANGIWRDVLIGMPVVAFLLHQARSGRTRGAYAVVIGLGSLAAVLTFSRMGWLCLLLTLILIGLATKKQGLRVLAAVMIAGVVIFLSTSPPAQRRIVQKVAQFQQPTKGSIRYRIWQAGFRAFQSSPAVGTGPLSAREVLAKHGEFRDFNREHVVAHNPFLEILIESGAIGLMAFSLLWAAALVELVGKWRRLRNPFYRSGMTFLLISLGVASLSSLVTGIYLNNLQWYVLGLAFTVPKLEAAEEATDISLSEQGS
jgi:O-antigen ligase